MEKISQILAAENLNVPAGTVDFGSNVYSMRVQKEFSGRDEILDIVVGTHDGVPVYLRDVARVEDAPEERAQEAYNDGEKGGMIIVKKQSGANSVTISRAVM